MFCKFCGKEISYGEVCFCEAAVNSRLKQQALTSGNINNPANNFQSSQEANNADATNQTSMPQQPLNTNSATMAKKPANNNSSIDLNGAKDTLKGLLNNITGEKINIIYAAIFAGIYLVANLIFFICGFGGITHQIGGSMSGLWGYAILGGFLTTILVYGFSILLPVIGDLIKKRKINLLGHFGRCASISLVSAVLLILTGLSSFLSLKIAAFFLVFAMLYRIKEYLTISRECFVKEEKSLLGYIIPTATTTIVIVIFSSIMFLALKNTASDIISSLMWGMF